MKYEEPFEDVQEVFDNLINKTDLPNLVDIKIMTDDKMKKIGKIVKQNELNKQLSGYDVVIIINQEIFDQLEPELQVMQAEELLAGISWNMEKDRLEITKADVEAYSGILRKYGYDEVKNGNKYPYVTLTESIKSLYDAKKEKES
jgi:hypothetical protein